MRVEHLVFVDDLLRKDFLSARAFIYSLLAEPLRQALGIVPPDTDRFPTERGLSGEFDLERFRALCDGENWIACYRSIPDEAAAYLTRHIRPHTLVVGYEMPPWLTSILDAHSTTWVDVRISPLRFARDLYLVLRSNLEDFTRSLSPWRVSEEELRIEAGLLRASIRHNGVGSSTSRLEDGVLFVGQTRADASLVADQGLLLDIRHFGEQIREHIGDRRVFYKPHPYDRRFARKERKDLRALVLDKVGIARENIYSLLASKYRFDVLTISSGVSQEARYFGRRGTTLFQPICDVSEGAKASVQIRFTDFASPAVWASMCKRSTDTLRLERLPSVPDNLMRRLHNSWWGYADYVLDNDRFWRLVLVRGTRNILRRMVGK